MRRVAVGVAGVAVLGLVAGGMWATGRDAHQTGPEPVTPLRVQPVAALTPVSDCGALLKHLKATARDVVGPYGLQGTPIYTMMRAPAAAVDSAAASGSAASGSAPSEAATAPDSTTNVQVAGVDESDTVKTDGDLLLAVTNGRLKIVQMNNGGTRTLSTWSPHDSTALSVLVHGTRAVVVGIAGNARFYPGGGRAVASDDIMPTPVAQATVITLLDISRPETPRVEQTLSMEGSVNSSVRLVDDELRFAISSSPDRIQWKQPLFPNSNDSGAQRKALERATDLNRKVLARTTIADWLPRATVTTDGQTVTRDLVDCPNVSVPKTFSGLETLNLVQLPLDGEKPLSSWRSAGVMASDSTLYADADHAWLATQQWGRVSEKTMEGTSFAPQTGSTQIHLFDTPLGGSPKYQGSGAVGGSLLNQFAMDEQNGVLRVATTVDGATTDNRVTTLKPDGGKLVQAGELTGLGAGERIQGVRFVGDLGYVVTFRQTDPLYTVDLSDPAKPVLRGELKIPGYSAYLHPVGDGRILGLGRDGTESGVITGLQLSLFDVSGADPRRLDRVKLDGAWSDAESDHHAFTMAGNLVLVPYSGPMVDLKRENPAAGTDVAPDTAQGWGTIQSGVLAVRVDGSTIGQPEVLSTPANPSRVVVHDGDVYTLTDAGIAVHAPDGNGFRKVTVARF